MANFLAFFINSPAFTLVVIAIAGACVGSFLNVIIHRLPLMMYKEWGSQCSELLDDPILKQLPEENISLAYPGSACPTCKHPIHPLHNIPVFSYLLLRAKCKYCGTGISPRYFLLEVTAAVLFAFLLYRFGLNLHFIFIALFTSLALPLFFIDLKYKLLPDSITYLLLWSGIIFALTGHSISLEASIIGTMAGYLSLWSVYIVFKLFTGKEGMGHGDFKLLAAIGAWVGWQLLLPVILISSISGTLLIATLMLFNRGKRPDSIPFGPFLILGGWITLLWGNDLTRYYFNQVL